MKKEIVPIVEKALEVKIEDVLQDYKNKLRILQRVKDRRPTMTKLVTQSMKKLQDDACGEITRLLNQTHM